MLLNKLDINQIVQEMPWNNMNNLQVYSDNDLLKHIFYADKMEIMHLSAGVINDLSKKFPGKVCILLKDQYNCLQILVLSDNNDLSVYQNIKGEILNCIFYRISEKLRSVFIDLHYKCVRSWRKNKMIVCCSGTDITFKKMSPLHRPNRTQALLNKNGASVITMFILAILACTIFLSLGAYFSYEINQNRFINIANRSMDKILVEGQLTSTDRAELISSLSNIGMTETSKIIIEGTPLAAFDASDSTYSKRGTNITFTVIYDKPHYIANLMAMFRPGTDKDKYRIGHKMEGMSEKW